jgi:hypothetical protein
VKPLFITLPGSSESAGTLPAIDPQRESVATTPFFCEVGAMLKKPKCNSDRDNPADQVIDYGGGIATQNRERSD